MLLDSCSQLQCINYLLTDSLKEPADSFTFTLCVNGEDNQQGLVHMILFQLHFCSKPVGSYFFKWRNTVFFCQIYNNANVYKISIIYFYLFFVSGLKNNSKALKDLFNLKKEFGQLYMCENNKKPIITVFIAAAMTWYSCIQEQQSVNGNSGDAL